MSAVAILKLQAAGFTSEQVSALAELVDTQAATKADVEASAHRLDLRIADLDAKIDAVAHRLDLRIADLDAKIDAVAHRLDLRIGDLDAKIDAVEHRLELKIDAVEHRLELKIADVKAEVHVLKWMTGFVLAFLVAITAKLFLHM
jgi:phage shock protein A